MGFWLPIAAGIAVAVGLGLFVVFFAKGKRRDA